MYCINHPHNTVKRQEAVDSSNCNHIEVDVKIHTFQCFTLHTYNTHTIVPLLGCKFDKLLFVTVHIFIFASLGSQAQKYGVVAHFTW